jgi:hypothetical protein
MLPNVDTHQTPSPMTVEEVQVVAISLLGLFLVFDTFPGFVVHVLDYLRIPADSDEVPGFVSAGLTRAAITNVIKIGLGLWLSFGARSFATFLQRCCPPRAG